MTHASADRSTKTRRPLRWALIALLAVAGPIALYALVAAIGLIPANADWRAAPDGSPVWVISNGTHVDLCVAARSSEADWPRRIDENAFGLSAPRVVCLGWGDRAFYLSTPTWDDLDPAIAARAVLLPTEAAMHVRFLARIPRGAHVRQVTIPRSRFAELDSRLWAAFRRDAGGEPILIRTPGFARHSGFFEAFGVYTGIETCNEWVAEQLRAVGVRVATWAPFARSVLYHLPKADPTR